MAQLSTSCSSSSCPPSFGLLKGNMFCDKIKILLKNITLGYQLGTVLCSPSLATHQKNLSVQTFPFLPSEEQIP